MTSVAVVGATGATGLLVVDQALARGWEVTALVRRAGALHERPGLSVVVGDPLDPPAAAAGVGAADAVVSVIGWRRRLRGPSTTTVYSRCARAVTAAVAERGSGRVVFCTSAGVEQHDPGEPWPYRHIVKPLWLAPGYEDMRRAEDVVRASGIAWVLVRPVRLSNGPPAGRTVVSERFRPPHAAFLSRADLAAFLLDQVVADRWLGGTRTIGGRRGSS